MGCIERLIDCMCREAAEIELEKKAIALASGIKDFTNFDGRHRKRKTRKSKRPARENLRTTFGPVAGLQ